MNTIGNFIAEEARLRARKSEADEFNGKIGNLGVRIRAAEPRGLVWLLQSLSSIEKNMILMASVAETYPCSLEAAALRWCLRWSNPSDPIISYEAFSMVTSAVGPQPKWPAPPTPHPASMPEVDEDEQLHPVDNT